MSDLILPPSAFARASVDLDDQQRLIRNFLYILAKIPEIVWDKQSNLIQDWYLDCIDKLTIDLKAQLQWP